MASGRRLLIEFLCAGVRVTPKMCNAKLVYAVENIYFDVHRERCNLCVSFPESSAACVMNLMVVHPEGRPEGHREGPQVAPQAVHQVLPAPRSVPPGASAFLQDSAAAVAFGRDTRPVRTVTARIKLEPDPASLRKHQKWSYFFGSMDYFTNSTGSD